MTNNDQSPRAGDGNLPTLPDPWDYCYEWDGPWGTRKFSADRHNGMTPTRSVPLYTADQMREYARAALAAAPAAPSINLQALIDIGTGKLPHLYRGECPTQVDGHEVRDPDCPACRALVLAAAPAAAPAQRVCHMECDSCISSGKCAHAEKARRDADHDVWMSDCFILLGDAEIRRSAGETEMPNYLLELAGRIAKAHLDEGYVQRVTELRAALVQAPATAAPAEGSQP